MLGQPIPLVSPKVTGVRVTGRMAPGVTATDFALTVTKLLRAKNVVEHFVEFCGPGLDNLTLADRATVANMAPEYGATMGFFPIDEETLRYLRQTGRSAEQVELVEKYCKAQGLFRTAQSPEPQFTQVLELDLSQTGAQRRRPQTPAGPAEHRRGEVVLQEGAHGAGQGSRVRARCRQSRRERGREQHRKNFPRLRGGRGDHELHEHVEPARDAGRGSPGEKSS